MNKKKEVFKINSIFNKQVTVVIYADLSASGDLERLKERITDAIQLYDDTVDHEQQLAHHLQQSWKNSLSHASKPHNDLIASGTLGMTGKELPPTSPIARLIHQKLKNLLK